MGQGALRVAIVLGVFVGVAGTGYALGLRKQAAAAIAGSLGSDKDSYTTRPRTTQAPPQQRAPAATPPLSQLGSRPSLPPTILPIAASPASAPVRLTLTSIRDQRLSAGSKASTSPFPSDRAGLRLSLQATLPDGLRLAEIRQPTSITASDSTSADLTAIEPNFQGEVEHFDPLSMGSLDQGQFTALLAQPQRSATRFSVSAQAQADVFAELVETDLPLATAWTPLDANLFGPDASYRVARSKDRLQVEIKPEAVRARIQSLSVLARDQAGIEAQGTMWGGGNVTFIFDQAKIAGQPISGLRASVRSGFQTLPLTIELRDVELP